MNTPSSISDNISLIAEPKFSEYASYLIESYIENEPLLIVVAEHSIGGCRLQELKGVDDALEAAEADPAKRVLLVSTLSLHTVLKMKQDLGLFLQLPNAFFARLPFESKKIGLVKTDFTDEMKAAAAKSIADLVHRLNHTTEKHLHNSEEAIGDVLVQRNTEVNRVKSHLLELRNLAGKAFIVELKKLCSELPIKPVMPGKEISGVYCDIEGTLLIDGVI